MLPLKSKKIKSKLNLNLEKYYLTCTTRMFNEIRDRHIQPPTTLLNHLLLLPSAPPTSNSICPYIQPSTKLIHIINILNVLNNSFIQFIVIDFFLFFFSFYILLILVSFKKYQKIKKNLKSKNNCVLKTCPSPRKHIRSTATVLTNCRWQLCRWFIRCLADLKIKKKKSCVWKYPFQKIRDIFNSNDLSLLIFWKYFFHSFCLIFGI